MIGFIPSTAQNVVHSQSDFRPQINHLSSIRQAFSQCSLKRRVMHVSRCTVVLCVGQDKVEPSDGDLSFQDYKASFNEATDSLMTYKWSDISFRNVQEELGAIEEYEKVENLPEDDPWPKFLRGAAYEHWGQPKLALAQYALTKHAGGLRLVPEIWERRGYNAFKIGEVVAANLYYEKASKISTEAEGNLLHFSHWFYENFSKAMPKHNGPTFPLQHAIAKYCSGNLHDSRELLVGPVATVSEDVEHALLFMMATCYRLHPDVGFSQADITLFDDVLKADRQWDKRLGLLLVLFSTTGHKEKDYQEKYYKQVYEIIEDEKPHVDITTHLYMALYHDAFTRDEARRDEHLDNVSNMSESLCPHDLENFLFHIAKNRLSTPSTVKMTEIPELVD